MHQSVLVEARYTDGGTQYRGRLLWSFVIRKIVRRRDETCLVRAENGIMRTGQALSLPRPQGILHIYQHAAPLQRRFRPFPLS